MPRMIRSLKKCGKGSIIKMNKKQYNNVIEHTLKLEQTEDSLSTARAIFDNMGVALPQGDMKTVYETIKTDDYMGWKSCTMQEAQAAADKGVAAIGISEDRIVVISANDEEQPVTQTASVMTLDENTSAFAVDGLEYYVYSNLVARQGGCGGRSSGDYSNELFDCNNRTDLIDDLISIMGNRQDLISYYTTTQCVDIILNYDSIITSYCNQYCVPKAFVQTLLLRELWCVDPTDTAADDAVKAYFKWMEECEYWSNLSSLEQIIIPYPEAPLVMREDCSTGIGQMHAFVAINANNLARGRGLINTRSYDEYDWHDCRDMWFNLHKNDAFAIKMMTLEMYHCATDAGVYGSLFNCTEAQIKAILARYNGTGNDATDYGNECYEYYKIFKRYS